VVLWPYAHTSFSLPPVTFELTYKFSEVWYECQAS